MPGVKSEKEQFFLSLKDFAGTLAERITVRGEWNVRGFIDIFRNVYALSSDTKVISKVLEIHLLPELLKFAEITGYDIEPAGKQNWYPDFTFTCRNNSDIKFAVDYIQRWNCTRASATASHSALTENTSPTEQAQRMCSTLTAVTAVISAWE